MRILALADVHNRVRMLEEVLKMDADLLLIAGDFTNGDDDVGWALDLLSNVRWFCVPGNMDPEPVWKALESSGKSLHKRKVEFEGITIGGFGGSAFTPFNTPKEYGEDEIYEALVRLMPLQILVVHHCPKGADGGTGWGSEAVRRVVEEFGPKICVCGHIHEGRGTYWINETLVVNPGPLKSGYYALIDYEKRKAVLGRLR